MSVHDLGAVNTKKKKERRRESLKKKRADTSIVITKSIQILKICAHIIGHDSELGPPKGKSLQIPTMYAEGSYIYKNKHLVTSPFKGLKRVTNNILTF